MVKIKLLLWLHLGKLLISIYIPIDVAQSIPKDRTFFTKLFYTRSTS